MAGLGGRRRRRMWQLIGGLCALAMVVSAGYAVRQILHGGGLQPADIAGVLGLPLTVFGLVLTAVALRKPIDANDAELASRWAATLAAQVKDGESPVWRELLGGDNRRINLTYLLHPASTRPATAPPAGRLTACTPNAATLPDIVTYYRATRPLRLVVTGAAGAGKTVLALELLLALIDARAEDDPVPVRIALARWDTERQSLPQLIRQRLVEAYDWPEDLAESLVRHGRVLPVLDGLDEMDLPAPDGLPDPAAPRATAVLNALNAYQQGRDPGPLILTCRTRHYDALTRHTEILDAARIEIAPVNPADARTYLADRALDAARWEPLLDHPATGPDVSLVTVLSTPWRLCLTATVYHHDGNPAELLDLPDADALDHHLLARYIPAATRIASNPRGYSPKDVHRWLHHLTTHLDPAGILHPTTPTGAQATDLVLHELWPLAGRTRVRTTDVLLAVLVVLAPLPLVWIASQPLTGMLAVVICVLAVVAGVSSLPAGCPSSLKNPFRTPQGRRSLAAGLAVGLAAGVTAGLLAGVMAGLLTGVTFGLAVGLGVGVIAGLTTELVGAPGPSLGARTAIRNDALVGLALGLAGGCTFGLAVGSVVGLTFGLAVGLALGLAGGSAFGLAAGSAVGLLAGSAFESVFGSAFGPAPGLVFGLVIGLPAGLKVGLGGGLTGSARAARRYLVFLLCSRRCLPFRLGSFLDWAVTAGLLRYSGPAYQYRHRELQHWLRQHPRPPAAP